VTAVLIQFVRKVYDGYSFEGAFFDAYAAAATEYLGDENFVLLESYGFYAASHHGAEFNAELITFFGFAFIVVHYGDAGHKILEIEVCCKTGKKES
jgi:hypothetical protein